MPHETIISHSGTTHWWVGILHHAQCHSPQLATHLSYLDPPRGEALACEYLDRVTNLRPTPADFYAKTVIRANPRHSALFFLEPTFILVYVSRPQDKILNYLEALLQYAKTIQPGVVDVNSDNDERYFRKLALFERILKVMQGGRLSDGPTMDGEGWEGGWGQFMAITWGLLRPTSSGAFARPESLDHPFV